jgi:hypothetical protein
MSLRLTIDQWAFWSPMGSDPLDWQASKSPGSDKLQPKDVSGNLIPMMHRRRMSTVCKTGVQVALKINSDVTIDYAIFCSQHGEVERSELLIDQLTKNSELSPTDFSLSVHNTTAGLYTIIKKSSIPSTSIASGVSSFASGWIEAEAYLNENRAGRVLLVNHDGSVPDSYQDYLYCDQNTFAFALLIRLADGKNGAALAIKPTTEPEDVAIGPEFLRWWLSMQQRVTLTAERQAFEWTR